jgi:outer membrane biosynthesis protein TonB
VNLGFRERRTPPGKAAGTIGTIVVHAAAAGFLFSQVKAAAPGPPVYAVELIAAPKPTTQRRLAREAVPTPPKEKPAPVKPKPTPPKPAPPKPEPKPPPTPESQKEAPIETQAPAEPLPDETPSTGTDPATIQVPGIEFPFPEYLRNIVAQVYQRWDREDARQNSQAEVSFMILRDGSVRDIRFVTRSGSFAFDLSAQGAIEEAGNSGAFGPLPDGWDADVLPVSFYFKPVTR